MSLKAGNNSKGKNEQNMAIFNESVMSLKLKGLSDRAAAKELNVAHSTINKAYHKQLKLMAEQSSKNIDNLRIQQFMRYEQVWQLCSRVLFDDPESRGTMSQREWTPLAIKCLAEQSKLFGLNTGDLNISIDNREQTLNTDNTDYRGELQKRITNMMNYNIKSIICQLILGEEYIGTPEQSERLDPLVQDFIETPRDDISSS
jgi:ATP-dependent phosphoenolpyruvate carboxykinase